MICQISVFYEFEKVLRREDQAGLGRRGREQKSMFQSLGKTQLFLSYSPKESY